MGLSGVAMDRDEVSKVTMDFDEAVKGYNEL